MTHIVTCGLHCWFMVRLATVRQLAIDSAKDAERAVQSFAVQPSLLRSQTLTWEEDELDAFLSRQTTAPLSPHLLRCP